MNKIVIAGSGVLGSQIAFQSAFHGYKVVVYDINNEFLEKAEQKMPLFFEPYKNDVKAEQEKLEQAIGNISYSSDLKDALEDADLLIEAIPENIALKKEFYLEVGKIAPEKTIFCTNTSTLLPSQFAEETGRPEKFLALHFANFIWKNNIAEVMGHAGTDPEVFNRIVDFSKSIGMVPIPIHKEQPGYVMNSLLVPFIQAGLDLIINGVADAETIDKAWMIISGGDWGPMAIFDIAGINTSYNIVSVFADLTGEDVWKKRRDYLKENFIDKNKLGISTGEGFYKYPNPAYQSDTFLK